MEIKLFYEKSHYFLNHSFALLNNIEFSVMICINYLLNLIAISSHFSTDSTTSICRGHSFTNNLINGNLENIVIIFNLIIKNNIITF